MTDKRRTQDNSDLSEALAQRSLSDVAPDLHPSELRAMVNMVRQKLHELRALQNETMREKADTETVEE